MATTLQIGDLAIQVTQKDIKNVHLSVHPPHGLVSIAAPLHLNESAIRAFAIGKLSWIRQQQRKLQAQECLEYILVHELVHLLEPTHNARFVALMDRFLPEWKQRRDQLNRLPVRHTDWAY
jgi:hypothetical protein